MTVPERSEEEWKVRASASFLKPGWAAPMVEIFDRLRALEDAVRKLQQASEQEK